MIATTKALNQIDAFSESHEVTLFLWARPAKHKQDFVLVFLLGVETKSTDQNKHQLVLSLTQVNFLRSYTSRLLLEVL